MEQLLRLDRREPRFHVMAGECHEALGALDQAVASYRRALQFAANDAFTLCRLGHCERLLGRSEAALAALRRALQLLPASAEVLNEMALVQLQAGQRAEAIESLRAAVRADARFVQAARNLAKTLYVEHLEGSQGVAAADVVAAFNQALSLAPDVEMQHLRDALTGGSASRASAAYVRSFYDRCAASFEEKLAKLEYRGPAVAAEVLAPRLALRHRTIADLGCGTGLASPFLRPATARLVGVDLSAEMLARAAERGAYDEVVQEDIEAWLRRQPAGTIDAAVALDVLIYIGDLSGVIRACADALAPGGWFALTVEALQGEGYALQASGRYAHAPRRVQSLAEAAGLRMAEARDFVIRTEAGKEIPASFLVFGKPR